MVFMAMTALTTSLKVMLVLRLYRNNNDSVKNVQNQLYKCLLDILILLKFHVAADMGRLGGLAMIFPVPMRAHTEALKA